jgi:Na+/H+ antiporter NhaD/arsenite permease-like protein
MAFAFLDNVTTVLLVAPLVLQVCRQLGCPAPPNPGRRPLRAGIIDQIGSAAVPATDQRWFLAATVLLIGSAVLGGFVDNIPYTAAMLPVVDDLVASDRAAAAPLWWAFALGALGGKSTAIAAGANVVDIGIAARSGEPISFWHFTRHGLVATALTLVIAWPYVWLR